ncbi:MAG: DUF975 family protein [Lachnospiraceae bacterium]
MMYAKDFRASARAALKGKWLMAMVAGLIAFLLGASVYAYANGGSSASSSGQNSNGLEIIYNGDYESGFEEHFVESVFASVITPFVITIVIVGVIISLTIGGAVTIGYRRYHLALMDGDTPSLGMLFSGFSIYGKAFLLNLLTGIYIVLWSMLFVIPGIIKSFSYAMAPFILAENPDMTPNEAITASRQMMDGNKWRLFCLNFSFIGWALLAALTCGLGCIPLEPYVASANAAFYREISQTWKVEEDMDFVK